MKTYAAQGNLRRKAYALKKEIIQYYKIIEIRDGTGLLGHLSKKVHAFDTQI